MKICFRKISLDLCLRGHGRVNILYNKDIELENYRHGRAKGGDKRGKCLGRRKN